MTRVGSSQQAQQMIDAIGERQAQMSKIQQQISTGRRILLPSDDPVAASQAEQTRSDIARAQTEHRMVDFARHKLQQAESAIGSGVGLFQSARDILVAANNDTNGPGERTMFAQQLRSMREELIRVANRSDGLGTYVFGGAGTQTPPFEETATGQVQYVADPGEQLTGTQFKYATSIDGQVLFNSTRAADGSRASVFDAMQATIEVLENPATLSDDLHTAMAAGIDAMDESIDQFSGARARIGEQLAAAERVLTTLDDTELSARARLSDLADTDFAEAISELSKHQSGLDASMKTYAQISGLSLFNYIR